MSTIISGTGRYLPEQIIDEKDFLKHEFYNADRTKIDQPNEKIISKFRSITGIEQRRYARPDQNTSDMGTIAAELAIKDAGIDPETLDGIIAAHNYGNVTPGKTQSDTVPSMASRIKHNLRIKNPNCVAFDVLFGCPGWIEGVIIAQQFLQNGAAKKYLVIGTETLSRVVDPHDRDSMIYADGAGASVLEYAEGSESGILSMSHQSHTYEETYYLFFGESNKEGYLPDNRYIKMHGRKIYEFALSQVPLAMKECLDKSGVDIMDVKKVFLHQANGKMDDAIIERFYKLYEKEMPVGVMPMTIHYLGNSSVATVPTLYDLVRKGDFEGQGVSPGDVILFASVGAGMNINAITYRV
ncbi:MAG: ketoacyl-ACP synthase III [Sphingobacteriales bacterium]|nr:MAG: ketoacyl-ACP synthase III [Sphingobacteriales bacterium]